MHSYYLLRLHILFYDWNRYRPQLTAVEPRSLLSCGPQWTCVRWSGMQNLVMKSTPDCVVPALFLGLGVESVAPVSLQCCVTVGTVLSSAVLLSVLFLPVLCCRQYCSRQCCVAVSTVLASAVLPSVLFSPVLYCRQYCSRQCCVAVSTVLASAVLLPVLISLFVDSEKFFTFQFDL